MRKDFPFYKQLDQMDCGPTCLRMIAKYHGKMYSNEFLRDKANITREGVSLSGIAEAAEAIGMHSLALRCDIKMLGEDIPFPCIAHWRQRHFVVVYKIQKGFVYVADPGYGLVKYSVQEFLAGWLPLKKNDIESEGLILVLETTPDFFIEEDSSPIRKIGFGFLIPYFKPFNKYIIQLFVGLFIGSCLQLVFPFLMQAIVDKGINFQNINFIYLILIAQLTLFISGTFVEIIRGWILLHITSRININLISDFLIKLMRLPISFFDSKNIGDLLQRIQDHDRVQNLLSAASLNVLFSVVNIILFGSILAYFNLNIFLIFIIGSVFYITWVMLFMKKRAILDYKRFDQASGNQSSIIQLMNGMQEIKLNNSERRRRWEWEAIQIKLFKLSIKSLSLTQIQNIGATFINEIKNIIITFIAAKLVIDGSLTLGTMLSVQYIIGQLNLPIINFVSFIKSAQDAKISIERLSEIHNKDNEEEYNSTALKTLAENKDIEFKEGLSFKYGGNSSSWVLEDLYFKIPEGKVTAIVGSSGSGKTTLIKLLLKFYCPQKGDITIGNSSLKNISTSFWRQQCGSVMQDGYIFADTIARNITESASEGIIDKDRLLHAVKMANIESFVESLPSGYNTRIGGSGINLSGGQKQRILIARAVYKNPKFLFFDEATSALDANNEKIIMENMENFYKGKTVIIVAHRLSTVKNADNILVLEKGKIMEEGNHQELIKKHGLYYTLVKNQLELGD